ncbi:MAG: VWA domain-containing protein [Polyangiales bacterium]
MSGLGVSLRHAGFQVDPARTVAAHRAALAVGLGDRSRVRAALRSVYASNEEEWHRFNQVFDAYVGTAALGDLQSLVQPSSAERARIEAKLRAESRPEALTAFALAVGGGGAGGVEATLAEALHRVDLSRLEQRIQVGFFTQRLLAAAGLGELDADVAAILDATEGLPELREPFSRWGRAVRGHARALIALELERRRPLARERFRAEQLATTPFAAIPVHDRAALEAEVRRFAERLKDRARARRHRFRGRLDVPRTLRASLRTGGVPFHLRFRRPRRERPRVVVVADISDSMRTVSRLFLSLVHSLHEVVFDARSFVFAGRLAEATEAFAGRDANQAVESILRGEVVPVAAMTDYGAALSDLVAFHRDAIDRRTTVVVLGAMRVRTDRAACRATLPGCGPMRTGSSG